MNNFYVYSKGVEEKDSIMDLGYNNKPIQNHIKISDLSDYKFRFILLNKKNLIITIFFNNINTILLIFFFCNPIII